MRVAYLLTVLLVGFVAGCSNTRPVARVADDVRRSIPAGWSLTSSNSTIRVESDRDVVLIGRISRPAGSPEEVARMIGRTNKYEVTLTFVPRLSADELEQLRAARRPFEHILDTGAPSKENYTQAQIGYERQKVPMFYTPDYSIFVDRPIDRFVEVYPPDAAAQVGRLMASLRGLFREY
jgi:hypothetical protein